MNVIGYPADENYHTPQTSGAPAYENAVQVIAKKRLLVSLYAFNSSGTKVYLRVWDSADGANGSNLTLYPVGPLNFVNVALERGKRFEKGIHVQAFTGTDATGDPGSVMAYDVDYTAYR